MRLSALLGSVAVAGFLLGSSLPGMAAGDDPRVEGAWVRMAPPAIKTHGAYLTIVNPGGQPRELVSAASENYEAVEIHVSRLENGVATMQRVETLEIPAGGKVEFKPGGFHLMLLGARKPLEQGKAVPIRFDFRQGPSLEFKAAVLANGPAEHGSGKNADHGGHGGGHSH